jgi:hypothetical protein
MMSRKAVVAVALVTSCVLLAGCATQPVPATSGDAPGFWLGVVHGFILPFAFVASFFTEVRIYAFPNNGHWYDFGFVVGVFVFGGGGLAARR